jgi:iron complex outermembrane receptor protein
MIARRVRFAVLRCRLLRRIFRPVAHLWRRLPVLNRFFRFGKKFILLFLFHTDCGRLLRRRRALFFLPDEGSLDSSGCFFIFLSFNSTLMRIGFVSILFVCVGALPVFAQRSDTVPTVALEEVVVSRSVDRSRALRSAQPVEVADEMFLKEYFTGNLMQTLEHLPGVHAMSIGSGFSKPMIRGMGFNRISVTENGIKQEGQQWGADHGLEIDAFGVERILVHKGPASLLLGSDAMGGTIEIVHGAGPSENQWFGEAAALGKTMNGNVGGSLMLGVKKNEWLTKLRFSEQHFGDYRIPTDTVVYLTQRLPIEGRRLKNTAGFERDWSWYTNYRKGRYSVRLALSDAFQKTGFFAGAHGIPDASLLRDDGDDRNIELPYSRVHHLKMSVGQQYDGHGWIGYWDAGFQRNHREEWSRFHTHYGTQPPPEKDADKELLFVLEVFDSSVKVKAFPSDRWEHTAGWDVQYRQNRIGGYSFLLPQYKRFSTGVFGLSAWRPSPKFSLSGGIRYDYGRLNVSAFRDVYLADYLEEQGYERDLIEAYQWRSYRVDRRFDDVSASLGLVWIPNAMHLVKLNIGRSFRLPGANELAANGVHHGTFRHEQGDASLRSERGWQVDASYAFERGPLSLTTTAFGSRFDNYLYLKPTGEWSVLPHAGQIYRYSESEAVFAGVEAGVELRFLRRWSYRLAGEYVYTYNVDENIPLPFSPPASLRHTLAGKWKRFQAYVELQSIAAQHRVSRNEAVTPGAHLWNMGATFRFPSADGAGAEIVLSAQNLLNTAYYNHLSFYRKVEIPEPGRNFQLLIKVPFKSKLK